MAKLKYLKIIFLFIIASTSGIYSILHCNFNKINSFDLIQDKMIYLIFFVDIHIFLFQLNFLIIDSHLIQIPFLFLFLPIRVFFCYYSHYCGTSCDHAPGILAHAVVVLIVVVDVVVVVIVVVLCVVFELVDPALHRLHSMTAPIDARLSNTWHIWANSSNFVATNPKLI